MIHFNNYGYSKKYREQVQAQILSQPSQTLNDKTKKLSIDNKKRRRQFEERQKVHERAEQRRREDALSSRRRRQQEATNAYKAALNKELNKRNKTRVVSAPSLSNSHSAATRRQIYRTPTVDEVLSNIRGHSVGGPLRTYGESTSSPTKNVVSFTSKENRDSVRDQREIISSRDQRELISSRDSNQIINSRELHYPNSNESIRVSPVRNSFKDKMREIRVDSVDGGHVGPAMIASAVYTKQYSDDSPEEPRLDDSLETEDLTELCQSHDRLEREKTERIERRDKVERAERVDHNKSDYKVDSRVERGEVRDRVERGEERISVQIDLTKFDQIDVSDCESDDPPIDPTMYIKPSPAPSSTTPTSSSNYTKTSPILLQADNIRSRASNYFGPPSAANGTPFRSAGTPLRVSYSAPNVGAAITNQAQQEVIQKSVSSVGLYAEDESMLSNFTIHSPSGDSHIYASNPVEAVKEASRTSAWGSDSSVTTECTDTTSNKQLKSLIKRTNSGKKKQVRWDSVKALDDETMEIDQFDISSEGEAVFTRAFSHPPRHTSLMFKDYYDDDSINLQRTPTDAEINALWNKVRTTLHRNQAWDTPQQKSYLPQRLRSVPFRRQESPKSDALKIYSNILVEKESNRYKFNKKPTPSPHGPGSHRDTVENGHTMLSMEEQRILQSLERLDAKLKDTGFDAEQKSILSYSSPILEVGSSRTPPKNETYKRLLNRNKSNGISPKFR